MSLERGVPAEGGRADDPGGLIGEVVGGVSPLPDAEHILVWCLLWHMLQLPDDLQFRLR